MKSLYSTFVVFTLIIMVISGLISFILSNSYYQHVLKPKNDEKYTEIAKEMAQYVERNDQLNLQEHFNFIGTTGYQIYVVDKAGEEFYFGHPFRDRSLEQKHIDKVLSGEIHHGMALFPKETFVTGFFANELENSIGVPFQYKGDQYALFIRPDISLHFNEMRILFAWLLGLTILISLLFEIILAKYLIQPVTKLTEATRKIGDGKFSLSFDFKRKDEIGELARSFQDMSIQLAKVDNMRNEFISNVTHDFQSPLSNISGYMELLSDPALPSEERKTYIEIIKEEAARLSKLTSQLLILSSLNQITTILREKEDFLLSDQIKSLIKKYQWQLFDKEITMQYTLPETTYTGSPHLLLSLWDNLLNNAIKYNKQGGSISVVLKECESYIEVQLKDTGIGMTEEQKEDVFERFYRADSSRSKDVAGTGLGLAIVDKIIALHDGDIRIESELGEGTTIIVRLPKKL